MSEFTHLDAAGKARMVDVSAKSPTVRSASAAALVRCSEPVMRALRDDAVPKGDVLAVAAFCWPISPVFCPSTISACATPKSPPSTNAPKTAFWFMPRSWRKPAASWS